MPALKGLNIRLKQVPIRLQEHVAGEKQVRQTSGQIQP